MRISDWSSDVCSSDLRRHRQYGECRGADLAGDPRSQLGWLLSLRRQGTGARAVPGQGGVHSHHPRQGGEIGRASCRERVCQYEWIMVDGRILKKKKHNTNAEDKRSEITDTRER